MGDYDSLLFDTDITDDLGLFYDHIWFAIFLPKLHSQFPPIWKLIHSIFSDNTHSEGLFFLVDTVR